MNPTVSTDGEAVGPHSGPYGFAVLPPDSLIERGANRKLAIATEVC